MVEGWHWILHNHRGKKRRAPEWFKLLATRKIAITTPNVLARLRRTDRESAKPYNFVLSPMQIFEGPTLIAPFCDEPSRWTGLQDGLVYISVEDGKKFRICKPNEDELLIWTPEFVAGKNSKGPIQYLLSTQLRDIAQVFREYDQHPESKSLAPDGSPCTANTRGLLRRRPIQAITPFHLIGKEVDRHAQDDFNVFSGVRPLEYKQSEGSSGCLDPISIRKLQAPPRGYVMRTAGVSQHALERALRGERVHPKTRQKLLKLARIL